MLKRIFSVLLIGATIACTATPRMDREVPGSNNLKPEPRHGVITKEIAELIANYSYKKVDLNDSIGGLIFDKYLKNLDPNRSYFLESDIQEFNTFKDKLDDDLKAGDLSTAFYMFNVYQKRYMERMKYSLKELDTKFDFTKDEKYVYSREDLPWFKNVNESNKWWEDKVKYDYLNMKLIGKDSKDSVEKKETAKKEVAMTEAERTAKSDSVIKSSLTKRYENLISQAEKINNEDAFQIIMSSFTESIDPHTNYFNPANAANFNIDMSRSLEGIGATLSSENEFVTIKGIVPGGPADKSKQFKIDDKIIAVAQGKDGEFVDVVAWRLDNAIALIRGKKGTIVRLKILSKNQDLAATPKVVELVREKIILQDQSAQRKVKTVTRDGKTYKYGIIEIPAFYADWQAMQAGDPNYKSTTRDVKLLLDSLKQDKVDGIIIDLRTNGGGSLLEAIELTGLFIPQGPVVQVRDLRGRVEVERDEDPSVSWNGPLEVLVDRFSASASEIFAGAIQDYGRGIIIGNNTYGKGTVQSAISMQRVNSSLGANGGQINLTTGKFYRVNGSSTQHKGVKPDIEFPMIFPADKYGESAEPAALPWDEIRSSTYNKIADLSQPIAKLKKLHEDRMKTSKEYQFLLADIQEFKEREAEKSLPLNIVQLKEQREKEEASNHKDMNERRLNRGLPALKKGEEAPKGEKPYDFIQEEALQIMTDFISEMKVAEK